MGVGPRNVAALHSQQQAAEARWERLQIRGMPRLRYQQNPLPIGPEAPPVVLYGPEQAIPPGLQVVEQGRLDVITLGPLFEEASAAAEPDH
ncbi:hypothetical protein [Cyanobium sp. ATX 6E8]|uniref:hypothetical protein n=1 Tax=Cyanobium sp. ATX 6E8 TaxID=2823701 RepID=UPI0020CE7414|nr:hypothetical protein [Cyanobium sp. ATX 6E8]